MSNHQENSAAPTVSDVAVHVEDDMMSETGSIAYTSVSSQVPPCIAKLIAKLSFLEEEMVRSNLSEEQMVQIQKSYAIYSKSLDMMLAVQKKLSKKDKVVFTTTSSLRSIVPSDLPVLQWTGNVHDTSKTVSSSVHECLDRFEDILESYGQDINANWCRLLPCMLSLDQRSWFIDHLKPHATLDWSFARKTLVHKYGIQDTDCQAQFMQKLFTLQMGRDDSVELYTDQFHKLRWEAGCKDDRVMAALYIQSLLLELAQHVTLGRAHLLQDKRTTIDQAANLARRLYGNVVHSKYSKQVALSSDSSTSNTAPSAVAGSSFAVTGKKNKGKKRAEAKYCHIHGNGRHSSDECRALSSLHTSGNAGKVSKSAGSSGTRVAGPSGNASSPSSSGKKDCFKCGFIPQTPGYKCEVNHFAIRSALLTPVSTLASGPAPVTPPLLSSSVPMVDNDAATSVRLESAPTTTSSASKANEDTLMAEVEDSLTKACFNLQRIFNYALLTFRVLPYLDHDFCVDISYRQPLKV
ncbi:hypothetical protein INT45_001105 [Circinella minor]|uniref:Retrotransposon gag domain-containing protein n=1 Tax=Circinella minor TaxID=1195481 RepID=A0A8H7VBB9_9FUNG|nr:hypothetical protein INT45_001105 [Circinella minor]